MALFLCFWDDVTCFYRQKFLVTITLGLSYLICVTTQIKRTIHHGHHTDGYMSIEQRKGETLR